jgi:diacylglycerol kinase family enzyme
MKVAVVVNEQGGTVTASGEDLGERLRRLFADAGVDAEIHAVAPQALAESMAKAAAAAGIDALVAAGGDGTVSMGAAAAMQADVPLGILPLGTLNHLARDAGIPAALEGAVAVIAANWPQAIDLAEVNGRIFVNNSAVGLYPMMVRQRDVQQKRFGRSKRLAMVIGSLRALRHFKRHRLTITAAGLREPIVTPLLFVGNNRYQTDLLSLGQREALDRGELCLYAVLARTRGQLIGLALRGLVGQLDQQRDFISLTNVSEAEITSPQAALALSADGETFTSATPLRYRILPKALRLLQPPPESPAPER